MTMHVENLKESPQIIGVNKLIKISRYKIKATEVIGILFFYLWLH